MGEARKPHNFWTEEETEQLEQGLKLHGKDVLKLREHLPNKSNREIQGKFQSIRKSLRKDNQSDKSDLLEILEKERDMYWTKDEHL